MTVVAAWCPVMRSRTASARDVGSKEPEADRDGLLGVLFIVAFILTASCESPVRGGRAEHCLVVVKLHVESFVHHGDAQVLLFVGRDFGLVYER